MSFMRNYHWLWIYLACVPVSLFLTFRMRLAAGKISDWLSYLLSYNEAKAPGKGIFSVKLFCSQSGVYYAFFLVEVIPLSESDCFYLFLYVSTSVDIFRHHLQTKYYLLLLAITDYYELDEVLFGDKRNMIILCCPCKVNLTRPSSM